MFLTVFDSFFPFYAQAKSESLTLLFAHLTVFPLFYAKSKSFMSLFAHSFFFKERVELFASVVLYERVTWGIRSGGS